MWVGMLVTGLKFYSAESRETPNMRGVTIYGQFVYLFLKLHKLSLKCTIFLR